MKTKITHSILICLLLAEQYCYSQNHPHSTNIGKFSKTTGLAYIDGEMGGFSPVEAKGASEAPLFVVTSPFKSYYSSTSSQYPKGLVGPPHGIWLHENVFLDETEITNIDWLEFLYYTKQDSSLEFYNTHLPQPTELNNYFGNPAYHFFPVVGITHQQAVDYCKWRGNVLTFKWLENLAYQESNGKKEANVRFSYRLPSEKEWELAAQSGLEEKYEYGLQQVTFKPTISKKALLYLLEHSPSVDGQQLRKDIDTYNVANRTDLVFNVQRELPAFLTFKHPFYVYGYARNTYGFYNLIGNVAEMVLEEGIAKGGSWKQDIENSKIKIKSRYLQPSSDLGFRCACEVEMIK